MNKKKEQSNAGIIMGDGSNLSATNVVAGDGATINSVVDRQFNIASEIIELKKILTEASLIDKQKEEALSAVETIEQEAKKGKKIDSAKIKAAFEILESLGKASSAFLPLADKIPSFLKSIGRAIF